MSSLEDALLVIARAGGYWREQAEEMERQRNAAFAEHDALASRAALGDTLLRLVGEYLHAEIDAQHQPADFGLNKRFFDARDALIQAHDDALRRPAGSGEDQPR